MGFSIGTSKFQPPVHVARHPVRRRMKILALRDGSAWPPESRRARDARDRPTMLLRRRASDIPLTPGLQAADAAHHEIDLPPALLAR